MKYHQNIVLLFKLCLQNIIVALTNKITTLWTMLWT